MNISDTLSVDPGRTTLGDLHPEFNGNIIRRKHTVAMRGRRSAKKTLNFIFGINALRSDGKAVAMLLIRWILGTILTVSGCFILTGEIFAPTGFADPSVIAIIEIVVGSMLALGLFTRFAMGVATIGFTTLSVMAMCRGMFDMQSLMSATACMVFLVFGSGKYSCDFLLRKAIIIHNRRRRRKTISRRMSYRAFSYASVQ